MDWGLAKVLPQGGVADDVEAGLSSHQTVIQTGRTATNADLSQAGSIMGTPAYMPPEQASGDLDRLDERADVFRAGLDPLRGPDQPAGIHRSYRG